MVSGMLRIHQNKGMKVSTSQIWGSSVLSKASSFLFVTEEAALVNLDGKPGKQAGKVKRLSIFYHQCNMENACRVQREKRG